MKRVFQPWPVVCFSHYVRCRCDLEGKIRGKRCPDCDGWGVLLEELPPRLILTQGEQLRLQWSERRERQ